MNFGVDGGLHLCILNKSRHLLRPMNDLDDNNTVLEDYASHLGLRGTDFDLFYESYYSMDTEEIEEILDAWEEYWNE